jgi:hypothetical protein
MEPKMDNVVTGDLSSTTTTYMPDPHSQLTTLTSPSVTSFMDYGQPSAAVYSHDVSGAGQYYGDYDWSQQQGQTLNGLPADPSAGHSYLHYSADKPDLTGVGSMPLYAGYHHSPLPAHGHAGATDFYGATPTLWSHHHAHQPHSHHHHHPSSTPMLDDPHHMTLTSRYTPSMTVRSSGSSSGSSSSGKPKRRRVQTVPQRKAANIRERRRMFHLNTAFDELRKRLPAFNYEKRLSRIETLRLAMTYIGFMKVRVDTKNTPVIFSSLGCIVP